MKLTIAILAAGAFLRFATPGEGSYYVLSTCDGCAWRVEASDWNPAAVNVTVPVTVMDCYRIFKVEWRTQ